MPHLFVIRPRLHDLLAGDKERARHFRWETINAIVYKLGGIIFIAGSVFFFPSLNAFINLGVWLFVGGSLLYALVTGHDMAEVINYRRTLKRKPTIWDQLEFWAAVTYFIGSILFTVGSLFFLTYIDLLITGTWCFIIGSLLFIVGAIVNVLQIVQASDMRILQLMNLTALAFVIGSVLFTIASVPYLWTFADSGDRYIVDTFVAWTYITGSSLFLLGGIFNYWRAYCSMKVAIAQSA